MAEVVQIFLSSCVARVVLSKKEGSYGKPDRKIATENVYGLIGESSWLKCQNMPGKEVVPGSSWRNRR